MTQKRQTYSKGRESIGFEIGLILTTNNGTTDYVFLCCWQWNVCESNINIYMNIGMTRQRQLNGKVRESIGFGIGLILTTNNGTTNYVFLCCWWWNVHEYCDSNINIYMSAWHGNGKWTAGSGRVLALALASYWLQIMELWIMYFYAVGGGMSVKVT